MMTTTPRRRGARPPDPEAVARLTRAPERSPVTGKVTGEPGRRKLLMSARFRPEDMEQLRAGWRATRHLTGYESLTDLVTTVVMAEVRRLQEEFNGGRPFPPAEAGRMPTGSPLDGASGATEKMTFALSAEDAAQLRGTFLATMDRSGYERPAHLIRTAVMAEVRRLQVEYHDGDPWPPLEPGRRLPGGPPVGRS